MVIACCVACREPPAAGQVRFRRVFSGLAFATGADVPVASIRPSIAGTLPAS
ncbi:MAG TPA: hypothetical protein VF738_14280 [Rhodanobacter sp.]